MENLLRHKRKALYQIIIPIVISVLLLVLGYFLLIPFLKNQMLEQRKNQSRDMVLSIYNLVETYYHQTEQGKYTREHAKQIIDNTIRNLKYGDDNKDYFWLMDRNQVLLSHPYYIDSTSFSQINRLNEKALQRMVEIAVAEGEGFITYHWQFKDDTSKISPKISFVKLFGPWNWIIGTGFYIDEVEQQITKVIWFIGTLLAITLLLILVLNGIILWRALKNVKQIIEKEKEAFNNEKRFRNMAEKLNMGLIILEDRNIIFLNQQIHQIFQLELSDITKFNIRDFVSEEELDRFNKFSRDFGKTTERIDFWIKLKNGERKFVENRISTDMREGKHYVYVLTADVTQQKKNEQHLIGLLETLNQSPDSTVITDIDGNITYVNKRFEEVTGYSSDEVLGKNPRILKSNKMAAAFYTDLWNTISSGQVWQNEMLNRKKDGELFWEFTIVFPIMNTQGEIINYAAIKTDLTRQKSLESELIRARERAEISEKAKAIFLNNISHEVRTPLNAIMGFSDLMKEQFKPLDREYQYLKTILKNTFDLLNLFQEIMDYSELKTGIIRISPVDVPIYDYIQKLATKFSVKMTADTDKPVEMVVEINPDFQQATITIDKDWLSKIMNNIIENAVKFTEKGFIKIGFTIDESNIIFYVKDTGVGIPKEEQVRIFDSFTHGENLYVSLHKGTGLGLNIATLLVEKLGGKITLESEKGEGTTFFISLPSIDVKNYTLNKTAITESAYLSILKDKRVLIAESDEETYQLLNYTLNKECLQVIRAKDGLEVAQILDGNIEIQLAFVSVYITGFSAHKIANAIKITYPGVPVIGITPPTNEPEAVDLQIFDALVSKPFQKNLLFEVIHDLLH